MKIINIIYVFISIEICPWTLLCLSPFILIHIPWCVFNVLALKSPILRINQMLEFKSLYISWHSHTLNGPYNILYLRPPQNPTTPHHLQLQLPPQRPFRHPLIPPHPPTTHRLLPNNPAPVPSPPDPPLPHLPQIRRRLDAPRQNHQI